MCILGGYSRPAITLCADCSWVGNGQGFLRREKIRYATSGQRLVLLRIHMQHLPDEDWFLMGFLFLSIEYTRLHSPPGHSLSEQHSPAYLDHANRTTHMLSGRLARRWTMKWQVTSTERIPAPRGPQTRRMPRPFASSRLMHSVLHYMSQWIFKAAPVLESYPGLLGPAVPRRRIQGARGPTANLRGAFSQV